MKSTPAGENETRAKIFLWAIVGDVCGAWIGLVEAENADDAVRKIAVRQILPSTREDFANSHYGPETWDRLVESWKHRIVVRGTDEIPGLAGDKGIWIDSVEEIL